MKLRYAALTLPFFSVPALADQGNLTLGAGFDLSTGKYGTRQSTTILYIPFTAKYQADDWFLKLTVPYISMTGPGGVVRGLGLVNPNNVRMFRMTNSGLGDITASAGHTVYDRNALSLDLVGNIKLGTADAAQGLGTGQDDYSAQIDGYYALDRKSTLFGTVGYKIYGSPPGITLKDAPYGTIGASTKTSESQSVGVMLDMAKSPGGFTGPQREVTLFVTQRQPGGNKVQVYILKGFASGSPDIGLGAMLTGKF